MSSETVLLEVDARGVATVTMNRPKVHNAFDEALVDKLTRTLIDTAARDDVRVVVLTGAGRSFSSGADMGWMRSMIGYSEGENIEDALKLAELMSTLNALPKPTIARINGHAFGGGVGLVCCCDIAIAAEDARFALSEVRLGLVPAVISPYVIDAIGVRHARRFFLTAEPIPARKARRVGMIHEIAKGGNLDAAVEDQLEMLLKGGPVALRECKALIHMVDGHTLASDQALRRRTAELIAQLRIAEEGQEGLSAFLEKRTPEWISGR
jgi:methylglutaconyl-CoA hydratase